MQTQGRTARWLFPLEYRSHQIDPGFALLALDWDVWWSMRVDISAPTQLVLLPFPDPTPRRYDSCKLHGDDTVRCVSILEVSKVCVHACMHVLLGKVWSCTL